MGSCFPLRFIALLFAVAAIHGCLAQKVEFAVGPVATSRGGRLFRVRIGEDDKVKKLMSSITTEIWGRVLGQTGDVTEKVRKVTLSIDEPMKEDSSFRELKDLNYEIHISAKHLLTYENEAEHEFPMLFTYEMTHVLQYTANGDIPKALRNGIAAYAVIKLQRRPFRWQGVGAGDAWDESPEVTGHFLFYCEKEHEGLVQKLNKKMKDSYDAKYFKEITGKTVDELWKDYKESPGCRIC